MANEATLHIRQVRSKIGQTQKQREVLRTLGLRRIGHTVERPNNPAVRGAVLLVAHLVTVNGVPGTAAGVSVSAPPKPAQPKAAKKKTTKKKVVKKAAAKKTTKKAAKKTAKKRTANKAAKKKTAQKASGDKS